MSVGVPAILLVFLLVACGDPPAPSTAPGPDVVVFLADDQGWTGTSVQMDPAVPESRSDYYRTPALEAFARQGVRFSNAYAAAALCTPTRASLQTGRSPAALHMTGVLASTLSAPAKPRRLVEPMLSRGLPPFATTIADAIRSARPDSVTAYFGKWHLGPTGPGEQGYTMHDPGTQHLRETDLALEFVRARAADGAPFFLQLAHYGVHKGVPAAEASLAAVRRLRKGERHRNERVAAMTLDLDLDFGRLLDALETTGLAGRTFVFYLSDNGGYTDQTSNRPLSGGKFSTLEGGIRIPFLVRGPGVAQGEAADVPVIVWDVFPTVLDLIGVREPPPSEGGSLVPLLLGATRKEVARPGEALVWHYPHYYHLLGGSAPQSAIREGRFKLRVDWENDAAALFDLEQDLAEAHDLSGERPEVAKRLRHQLDRYLHAIDAQLATTAPATAPRRRT